MSLSIASSTEIAPGVRMPMLGFGTYKSADGPEVYGSVRAALEIGYRGVDTASLYENEQGVGRALRDSGLAREDLFVATKVWNDDQGFEGTVAACERSLRLLGLEHVDLYMVHWPSRELMADTWRAMELLLARGRTRAIGVCNHLPHHVRALLAVAEVPPAVDQVEHHPWLQRRELRTYCREAGITMQAWAPVMRGRVGEVPELVRIAAAHAKTPAQVSLRWMLQHGVSALPKSVHHDRIVENADVFDFDLSADEMRTIDAISVELRLGKDPDEFFW
ncbi:MAG: aldo/keto reductase [Coriobacteriia bacterium]|nr:aldo/keto reductase [Coriobacteriia bacterium]